jgi:hypothetical protein
MPFGLAIKAGEEVSKNFLFLNQHTLKDRPGIKAGAIGAPETPSIFILFLNRQVSSAVLVFDPHR